MDDSVEQHEEIPDLTDLPEAIPAPPKNLSQLQKDSILAKIAYKSDAVLITDMLNEIGYTLLMRYPINKGFVCVNNDTGEYNLVIRGTDPMDTTDLKADFLLYNGALSLSPEYKNQLKTLLKIFSDTRRLVRVIGHSLGGTIGIVMCLNHGQYISSVQTFNAGISAMQLKQYILKSIFSIVSKRTRSNISKIHIHRIQGDPISFLGRFMRNSNTIKPNGINPHSIRNFTGGAFVTTEEPIIF